jgi:hypothetical protein
LKIGYSFKDDYPLKAGEGKRPEEILTMVFCENTV